MTRRDHVQTEAAGMKRNWSWRWRRRTQDWLTKDLDGAQTLVQTGRWLAARSPRQEVGLPSALIELGIRLAEAGRHEEALDAVDEATQIGRRHAADEPSKVEPNLATGLFLQARWLAELHRFDEALAAVEESIVILSPTGALRVPAREFPSLPESHPDRDGQRNGGSGRHAGGHADPSRQVRELNNSSDTFLATRRNIRRPVSAVLRNRTGSATRATRSRL
jgi:tetratricopeptide (TPR) repeat protein